MSSVEWKSISSHSLTTLHETCTMKLWNTQQEEKYDLVEVCSNTSHDSKEWKSMMKSGIPPKSFLRIEKEVIWF
jgi:hypothetical protein